MLRAMPAASASDTRTLSLLQLLDQQAPAREIEAYLDGLAPAERLDAVLAVRGKGVKKLYLAVEPEKPLSLEEFVPANTKGTLIYEGRNSLPLFSRFQKRFVRLEGGKVIGYNHQAMSFVTGPGYFVLKPPSGEGAHANELLFDYTEAPGAEPDGWPAYKPNDAGLSRPVYGNMHDYVRRVARGVVVGKAYKLGIDQDAYFSLTLAV
jgi:hypothetical protein